MKVLRNILVTAFLTLGTFFAVTYTACTKDHCNNVVCMNGGACDRGSCTCATGFEGSRCEVLSRTKFIANFNGGDSCGIEGHRQYSIRFLVVPANKLQMTMKNILGNNDDSAICNMAAIDSFTFNGNNNSITYAGFGKISNDSLHLSYHVQYDTVNYDCKFFGLRY